MRAKYLSYGTKRELTDISEVLGRFIERATLPIDVRQGDLVKRWLEIAPGDWADVAEPIGIRDQVLLVEVPTGAAGSLLKYQVEDLCRAIDHAFGSDLVRSVRLRVAR